MAAKPIAETPLFADPDAIALYTMDGDSVDDINAYNGADTAMSYDSTSKFGQAALGNGSTSRIVVSDNADLDIGTSDFAVSFWARPDASQIDVPSFVTKRAVSTSTDVGWTIGANNSSGATTLQIRAEISDGSVRTLIDSAADVLAVLTYTNVIVNFDRSANATIYINNVVSGTPADITAQQSTIANALDMEMFARLNTRQFKGRMDDVFIIKRLLTASERSGIVNGFPAGSMLVMF